MVNTDVATSVASSIDSTPEAETNVRNIISVVKPADMPVVSFGSKKEDQLLGCDVIYNSDSLNVLPTRIFDEKGRLTYVKSPDGSYNHYVYAEDKQGRTISEDKYEHKTSDEAGKETLLCSKTYGYDHLVGDEWQPNSKEESSYVAKPQFALIMPSSSVKALNSSAYISDVDSTFFADKSDLSSHANYTWDGHPYFGIRQTDYS